MNKPSYPQVHFFYYEDCPSHETALARLRAVLAAQGLAPEQVLVTKVETQAQARELGFIGSPTILIDGRDIDPVTEDAQPGLSCRAYRLENGRISPLPSEAMIRTALQQAVAKPTPSHS